MDLKLFSSSKPIGTYSYFSYFLVRPKLKKYFYKKEISAKLRLRNVLNPLNAIDTCQKKKDFQYTIYASLDLKKTKF